MSEEQNPLLVPSTLQYGLPNFPAIKTCHMEPAMMAGIKEQLSEVDAIVNNPEAPTFENTFEAMERSGATLNRAANVFFNLSSTDSNDEIRALDHMIPRLAAHHDDIYLNAGLFARVKTVYDARESLGLTGEPLRLCEHIYKEFVRSGAELSPEQQTELRALNERVSALEHQFTQTLLKVDETAGVVVDTVEELAGLDAADVQAAKEAADARGLSGKWLLTLVNTTRNPLLESLSNRDVRRRLWTESRHRARGGDLDNTPLVEELAKLRASKAELLGFPSFAALHLSKEMAGTPAAALEMLQTMVAPVVANVHRERADIAEAMARDLGVPVSAEEVQPWDWEFYAEKVRAAKFALDADEVKPYFEFETVLQRAVFDTFGKLYGVRFEERPDLPVYHPDVRAFEVFDESGESLAIFLADYFKRKTAGAKQGGAWMNNFVEQTSLLEQKPVVVNVMNIAKASQGPTLISFDDCSTALHELGHGMHGMLSQCRYPSLAGTCVSTDYVEMPSTVHEDWAAHPDVLPNYALHHETGAPMPTELVEKLIASRQFNQGFETLEYLAASLVDLELHSLSRAEVDAVFAAAPSHGEVGETAIDRFEAQTLAKFGADVSCVPPRYSLRYFAHSMGGYSASYYAYMWSEILAADAFAFIRDNGRSMRENGMSFRKEILSRGSSRDTMESYVKFRGCKPTTEGLLVRRGIKPASTEEGKSAN